LLDALRKAQSPILNCDLVETIMRGKELDPTHRETRHAVENRVPAALQRLEAKKDVQRIGKHRETKWALAPA